MLNWLFETPTKKKSTGNKTPIKKKSTGIKTPIKRKNTPVKRKLVRYVPYQFKSRFTKSYVKKLTAQSRLLDKEWELAQRKLK